MAVRILQPGDHRGALQVENLSLGPLHPHHVLIGSDTDDPFTAYRHGLNRPGFVGSAV